jgi:hypothetical protein
MDLPALWTAQGPDEQERGVESEMAIAIHTEFVARCSAGTAIDGLSLIALVVLIAVLSRVMGGSRNEDEEEIRYLREIIARDVEREREGQGPTAGDVLAALIVAVVLTAIILALLGSPTMAAIR